MTVIGLIILIVASIFIAVFGQRLPHPWPWVAYGVIVVLWLLVFVFQSGIDGGVLNQRLT